MRHIILTIIVICLSVPMVKAQRLTYNDLLFGLNHNFAETEDYLLNKGLTFSNRRKLADDDPSPLSYNFDKDSDNLNYISFSINEFNKVVYSCTFTTLKLTEYIALRNYVKSLGYIVGEGQISDISDYSTVDYFKGPLKVVFGVYGTSSGHKMYSVDLVHIAKQRIMLSQVP